MYSVFGTFLQRYVTITKAWWILNVSHRRDVLHCRSLLSYLGVPVQAIIDDEYQYLVVLIASLCGVRIVHTPPQRLRNILRRGTANAVDVD
jgi:hypothetical protein